MKNGLPEGVTLEPVSDNEATSFLNKTFSDDELKQSGITLEAVEAPHNTVFDQDNERTIALPQTLNADETDFMIKRDADQVKNFFAMQDVGGFEALGSGIESFFASLPQAGGTLLKQQAELSLQDKAENPEKYKEASKAVQDMIDTPVVGGMFKWAQDMGVKFREKFGDDEELLVKSQGIIDRNKKYMAEAGLERPEQGGFAGFMYDLGQGGSSLMAALALAGLTRSPATAAAFFGAIQNTSVYQEARAAGKDAEEATAIAFPAAVVEGGLEFVGLDHFMKALKGNTAVKRFIKGFAIEATQEASQGVGEELITQGSGIREKSLLDTVQDVLYQGFLGGILGGTSNATIGAFVSNEAEKRGIDKSTAKMMGDYAEKNVDAAQSNLGEFIDKELAPIAADDKSAMEFITLMQKFNNDQDLVNPNELDPEQRAVFDKYVKMFNESVTDKTGVQNVEKKFYDQAIAAGVSEEEAVAASKLVGARADAASRALGISPMEWLDSKNISLQTPNPKKPEDEKQRTVDQEEAKNIKEALTNKRSIKGFDRNNASHVQKKLQLENKPVSVLQFIKDLGGISLEMSKMEVDNVKAARKSKGKSASKASMASGELQKIFDGKKTLGRYVNENGVGFDVIYGALKDAGYFEETDSATDERQAVLDLIEREVNGGKIYPVDVERQIEEQRDGVSENFDFLEGTVGITADMTEEQIAEALRAYRQDLEDFEAQRTKEQVFIDDEIPFFQDPSAYKEDGEVKTNSQAFKDWFGDSKVVDEDGEPLVVYHGTTADFEAFDREKANPESDLGSGFYFSNTVDDVGANYAGFGPDLTGKIEREAERIADETDRKYDDPEVIEEARKKFAVNEGATIPAYISMKNPVYLGGDNETYLEYEENYDEETDSYDEPSGSLIDFVEGIREASYEFDDVDADKVASFLFEQGQISASDIIHLLKSRNTGIQYAQDENGNLVSNEVIRRGFEAAGFDGFIDYTVNQKFGSEKRAGIPMAGMNEETVHYIAFRPEQIKSVFNRGTFDKNDARILYQSSGKPVFYSAVDRAVEGIKQEKGTGDQFLAQILNSNGVKAEEVEWIGLDEFLKGKKSVTKEEIAAYLRDNQVQIEEVTLGGKSAVIEEVSEAQAILDAGGEIYAIDSAGRVVSITTDDGKILPYVRDNWDSYTVKKGNFERQSEETKFSQYTLPDGENYREVLLTLPEKDNAQKFDPSKVTLERKRRSTTQGSVTLYYDGKKLETYEDAFEINPDTKQYEGQSDQRWIDSAKRLFEKGSFDQTVKPISNSFRSHHFDQPNILAHVRLNDRTDANGKRVLFVEEIQSDWHQAGRKKGYSDGKEAERLAAAQKELSEAEQAYDDAVRKIPAEQFSKMKLSEVQSIPEAVRASEARQALSKIQSSTSPPNAPFKKSWHELAFKRILQMAVEGGYDSVAWTTGEQQADRFDLSKQVGAIEYKKSAADELWTVTVIEKDGTGIVSKSNWITADAIEELVGKDMAQKIINGEGDKGGINDNYDYVLKGDGLKIGGEGMKGFYDNILVKYANKFGKKFGAKVGQTEINQENPWHSIEPLNDDEAAAIAQEPEHLAVAVHSLDVTPEMREAVQSGLTLFQGNKAPQGSVTFGKEQTIIKLFEGANKSTLLHELGHIFLRDMRDIAKKTDRPRVKKDYDNVKKWLGAKGDTLTVAQEEKFARGFEAYLREGKAPKPELQGIFDTFKKWLSSIYKSVKQLNVNLNPDVRQAFDRMLGGDFAMAEQLNQEAFERDIAADYEAVANYEPESTIRDDASYVLRNARELAADAFVPISTRLGNINQGLKHAVRKFVFKTGIGAHKDNKVIEPFINAVSNKFSEQDYRVFDLALKNRDEAKVDFLVEKYGIEDLFEPMKQVLDRIYLEAADVGLDMNYLDTYFPRKVKRELAGEFMAMMRGKEEWSEIEAALIEADPNGTFDAEEQAAFVNSFLRGFSSSRINLSKPSFTKERMIDYITPEMNKYYQDSMPTLIQYIAGMRHGIEARKLFGRSESETDQNIGAYVLGLVRDGVINASQEQELKKILKAVVEPASTRGAVTWLKNANYIYLMGSPISAITQIQDLAFSLHKNGYWRTGKSLLKSLTGNQVLKKEDLGLENILQEFEDSSRSSDAVKAVFNAVGLTAMDNIGKEVYIDATYSKLRKQAKKNSPEFKAEMKNIFGDEAAAVTQDLVDGNMTENVKYILFSELSDIQPISLAEMPVGYLAGGNYRVLYMLKTYTMKQIDIYRREIFSNLASGEVKKTAKGMKNLVSLASALMLMGMGTDALKDLILGRDIDIDELVMDNILKTMAISKYNIYQAKIQGIGNAIFRFLTPPLLAPVDDLRDVSKIASGDKDVKDAEILKRTPLIGQFYYWWYGGGSEK